MKKIVLTLIASAATLGAFAQGSLTTVQAMFSNDGITTPGANASNPDLAALGLYYTGNLQLELFYSASPTANANVAAINALDGTAGGGAAALALLTAGNGWSLASASPSSTSLTTGFLTGAASVGSFTAATPNTIGLVGVPTGGTGFIALYVQGVGGTYAGYSGVLAWSGQALGGNLNGAPPGTAANIIHDPSVLNLVLTQVPEPSTMALAGLGMASMFLFRRRK